MWSRRSASSTRAMTLRRRSKVAEDWVRTNLPSMTKPSKLAGELVAH